MKNKNGETKSEYRLKYEDLPLFSRAKKKKKPERRRSSMVHSIYSRRNDRVIGNTLKTWIDRFRESYHNRKSSLKRKKRLQ